MGSEVVLKAGESCSINTFTLAQEAKQKEGKVAVVPRSPSRHSFRTAYRSPTGLHLLKDIIVSPRASQFSQRHYSLQTSLQDTGLRRDPYPAHEHWVAPKLAAMERL